MIPFQGGCLLWSAASVNRTMAALWRCSVVTSEVQPKPPCSVHRYIGQQAAGTRTRRPIALEGVSGDVSGGAGGGTVRTPASRSALSRTYRARAGMLPPKAITPINARGLSRCLT